MEDSRIQDISDKYDEFRKKNQRYFDSEFSNNLFVNLRNTFILPELDKRISEGRVSNSYSPNEILIKVIRNELPVIEFDEEIKKDAISIAAKNFDVLNEDVQLSDIRGMLTVNLEDMSNVIQYFYLKKIFDKYHIIANLDTSSSINSHPSLKNEELLGALHHLSFKEKIVMWQDKYSHELQLIGLWAAPALIPYPLNKILNFVSTENAQEARTVLLNHCNQEFIENLCYRWWIVEVFKKRQGLFVDTIDAHKRGKYRVAIHVLLPQIEGIMTDWIYENSGGNLPRYRQESKTIDFFNILRKKLNDAFQLTILDSTAEFILKGPVLESFKNWGGDVKNAFANRHVVEHGKYDESQYSEENSVKLFLLLDSIFYLLKMTDNINSG